MYSDVSRDPVMRRAPKAMTAAGHDDSPVEDGPEELAEVGFGCGTSNVGNRNNPGSTLKPLGMYLKTVKGSQQDLQPKELFFGHT